MPLWIKCRFNYLCFPRRGWRSNHCNLRSTGEKDCHMPAGRMLLSPVWYTGDKALFHGWGFSNICICKSFVFLGPSPISKHNSSFLEIQYFQYGSSDFHILLSPSSPLVLFYCLASWNNVRSLFGFILLYFTQSLDIYQSVQPLALSVSMNVAFLPLCTFLSYPPYGQQEKGKRKCLALPWSTLLNWVIVPAVKQRKAMWFCLEVSLQGIVIPT